jgi:peptidoglycan/LPS O-acetylase OafA/YrhL
MAQHAVEEPLLRPAPGSGDGAPPSARLDDIDGLRAVAVVAVLLFHLDEAWLPGGFGGVDVFFVISGFVVSISLCQRVAAVDADCCGDLLEFYARRAKRLAPSLLLVVIVTSLLVALLIPPDREPGLVDGYLFSAQMALLGTSNNVFAAQPAAGYFERGMATLEWNPYTHTWSLGVEEQFYLCFPLLLLALHHHRAGRAAAPPPAWRGPLAVLLVCSAASAALCWRLGSRRVPSRFWREGLAFYTMPARLWQLGCGAALFELQRAHGEWLEWLLASRARVAALELGAVLMLLRALTRAPEPGSLPLPSSLLPVGATLCLIAAGRAPRRTVQCGPLAVPSPTLSVPLATKPMLWLGHRSYPIYLWHWPLIVLSKWVVGFDEPHLKLAALLATLWLSAGSHGLETRVRHWKPTSARTALLSFAALGCAAEGLLALLRGPAFGALYLRGAGERGAPAYCQPGTPWSNTAFSEADCFLRGAAADEPEADSMIRRCLAPLRDVLGGLTELRGRTAYVLGDSHAAHLVVRTGQNHWAILSFATDQRSKNDNGYFFCPDAPHRTRPYLGLRADAGRAYYPVPSPTTSLLFTWSFRPVASEPQRTRCPAHTTSSALASACTSQFARSPCRCTRVGPQSVPASTISPAAAPRWGR